MRFWIILAALALAAQSANAQSEQVRRGPAPSWVSVSEMLPVPDGASGPAFVRRQDSEIHLSDQEQAQYMGLRAKILQSSALQMGNVAISWDPRAGAPIVHDLKVFRGGEVIDVLKSSKFEILRREEQLEAAQLNGVLTAILRVPDLRVGDELELAVTTFSRDPTLATNNAGLMSILPNTAPGRYHLGLSWDAGKTPRVRMTDDFAKIAVEGPKNIDIRLDNPESASPPKDVPARYRWSRILEYTDFSDWRALSRHFAPLFSKAAILAPDSVLKREAARIAAAKTGQLDRASAALQLVQQDVRYIYIGLNGGNLTPSSADETWQRRYGDCKAKTALLLALLGELGVEAEPVLVSSQGLDDGLDQRLPIPHYFDHVLVRARIEGKTFWLDGTLPPVAGPSLEPLLAYKWVLPLSRDGSDIQNIPWKPAAIPDTVTLMEIDARAGFDKPARKISTSIVRGKDGLLLQTQLSSLTPGQLQDAFRQRLIGDTWQSIDSVTWRFDQKAGAGILTTIGSGLVDWDDDGGGGKSMALPGGGFNPPERRVRQSGEYQNAPFYQAPEYSCHVTTVRLPENTEDRQWLSKGDFDTIMFGRHYYRAWELRGGAIRMVRGSRVEQPEIDAEIAKRDNERIAAFDNSMGWISFVPSRQRGLVGRGTSVPATYELDWTGNNVPCISPVNKAGR